LKISVDLPPDEKRVLIGVMFWNPDTEALDVEGFIPAEELKAMLHLYNVRTAECPEHG